MSYACADAILDRVRRECFPVRKVRTVSQWAEEERYVSARTSARAGRWSNARTPYLVGIQDAFCDPSVRQITVLKAPQVGFTEAIINIIGWMVEYQPVMAMIVLPNDKLVRAMAKKRVLPAILGSPRLEERLGTGKEDRSASVLSFDRCDVRFAAAGSDTNIRSWPAGVFIVDEYDRCPDGIEEEAEQRVTAHGDRAKIIFGGTPSNEDEGIAKQYAQSDQHWYWVPCPHCKQYQILQFERIRWDGGKNARPDDARATARYVCRHCRENIHEHHRVPMLQRGLWVPRGNWIELHGGECVERGTATRTSNRGFFIQGEISGFATFGKFAAGFCKDHGHPGKKFWNGLGRPWKTIVRRVDVESVRKLAVKVADGGFERGWVPPDAVFLTGTADTQMDRLWVQIDAWGPRLERSYLVDFFSLPSRPGEGMPELAKILDRGYPIFNRDKRRGVSLRPWLWLIDSGQGNRTAEVYKFVREHHKEPRRWVRAVKGFGGMGTPQEFKETTLDKFPDGTAMPGGIRLLELNTRVWKDVVMAQVGVVTVREDDDEHDPGSVIPMTAARVLPEDVPETYLHQLTAEELVERKKDGRRFLIWLPKKDHGDNHALDTTYYATAATRAYKLNRLTEEHREQWWRLCRTDVELAPAPPPPPKAKPVGRAAAPPSARETLEMIRGFGQPE